MRDRNEREYEGEKGKREGKSKMKSITTASRNQLFLLLSHAMYFKDEKRVEIILDEVNQRNYLGRR